MPRTRKPNPPTTGESRKVSRGIALPVVLMFTLLASWYAARLLQMLSTQGAVVQDDYNYTRALYLSESGLNRTAEALWIGFLNSSAQPETRADWLDANYTEFDQIDQSIGYDGDKYTVKAVRIMETGDPSARYIVLESTGKSAGGHIGSEEEFTERTITRVLRYGSDQSSIFDYVYFINNFGWLWGSSIQANGDVRANGNFSLKYSPTVNGDVYASINDEIGASGTVDGGHIHDTLDQYRTSADDNWRPTAPEFKYGYDGNSDMHQEQDLLEMPYLGDIDRFKELAAFRNGTLSTADVSIVHSTDGPVFLFGTPANPIQLNGPVAIDGDVVIAGYVEGQGTIYTDRNVHIVGDLIYTNAPAWDHTEGADPESGAGPTGTEDFLGLASRGNIIVGDYTNVSDWQNPLDWYLQGGLTEAYIDDDGNPHSGNYWEVDGLKTDGTPRRDFESSFDDASFQAMVAQSVALFGHDHKPRRLDCLAYTNHIFTGRVRQCNVNGAIMSRDEAIIYSNFINMNYDYRAKAEAENFIDIDLPRAANATPVIWLDGKYDDWVSKIDALDYTLNNPEGI